MNIRHRQLISLLAVLVLCGPAGVRGEIVAAVEFCLDGEFDLGARYQGTRPEPGEVYRTRFCVITENDSERVHFSANGHSNPDMEGEFAVSYLPPKTVRLVRADSPPDLEFAGKAIQAETLRHRRIDPYRLVQEINEHADWEMSRREEGWRIVRYPGSSALVELKIVDGKLLALHTTADMPLRGRVPVEWHWEWQQESEPALTMRVDGEVVFRAQAKRRSLSAEEARNLWQPSGEQAPRQIPGDYWPARINMQLERLADNVYFVRGVRTGFHHLVVDTEKGLVVGDAPAGWVELPQIPPADLVPGLGISGLSEQFIDFLGQQFPDKPIRVVVLTHAHDDHAGGARAFTAAGADVYAPSGVTQFLNTSLNRGEMPADRLSGLGGDVTVKPVADRVIVEDVANPVILIAMGSGPHVSESLGMWVPDRGFFFQSDLHVPNSDSNAPRTDRAVTECWFAGWAVDNLPPETVVLTSHGTNRSPVSRLARYLESDTCKNL